MILAIKTSDDAACLQLYPAKGGAPLAEDAWTSGRALADQLLARIARFTEPHGGEAALSGIIVFSGPGSFTSLRIGHTVANALADSLGLPVVGAMGEDWPQAAIKSLADTPPGRPALPHYGAEANITKPKT
ncbi:MAG TPA: hypothetical protein VMT30_03740 [Candidatus Saccharimonadia bacterium]|nr:hypothetical protein [Candidatus Saccharimonadia bacterium]